MKKSFTLVLMSFLLVSIHLQAQRNVVYPDDFVNGWDEYIGQTLTFTNRFYVGGFNVNTENYYTDMALLTEMRRTPTDLFTPGTPEYDNQVLVSQTIWDNQVRLYFGNGAYWRQRIGSWIENLTARVTEAGKLYVESWEELTWGNNRPTQRPDLGKADIVVCGANLQNFTPWIDVNYKSDGAPQTQEEAELQVAKVMNALYSIDADIYAFSELQDTATCVDFIATKLNEKYGTEGLYAGVDDNQSSNHLAAGRTGYVYRTTAVRPVGTMGYPDAGNYVYSRHQYVQHFEQLSTGGRFALSVNHFKAKTANSDPQRVTNMRNLINYLSTAPNLDNDVLVMGDLNTYSAEEPIVMLEDKGYSNMLSIYNPDGFTYFYKNEVGNMDHALASASLVEQITGAAVYQLNAEESWNYKRGGVAVTDDMYGYADHNPVLVGLTLLPEPEKECTDISYTESFSTSLGAFTSVNIAGTNDWYCTNGYVMMNGHAKGGDNEDWLVSPAFNLTQHTAARLSFQHAINFAKADIKEEHSLWITDNYTGKPNTTQWQELTIPRYPAGNSWTFVSTELSLPAEYLNKENIVFAFKYTCKDGAASAWEIKNLKLTAQCSGTDTEELILQGSQAYATPNTICISLTATADVAVYNAVGQCVYMQTNAPVNLHLPAAQGLYIVRIGNDTHKVIVP